MFHVSVGLNFSELFYINVNLKRQIYEAFFP